MQLAVNGVARMATDPESGFTTGSKPQMWTRFRIACRRDGQTRNNEPITDFYTVVCYGAQAQFVTRYLASGNLMAFRGRLSINAWTDRSGVQRRDAEITADRIEKLEWDERPAQTEMPPAPDQAPAPLAGVPESSGDASVAGTSIPPFQAPPAAPAHSEQDDPYAVTETAAA